MELSEETFDQIHQYLSGQGSPAQRADFEKRIQTESDLANELATQRRIRNGLKANEYRALFKDIHAQLQSEGSLPASDADNETGNSKVLPLSPKSASRLERHWSYLAAAASVVIGIGIVWYVNFAPKNTQVASDTPSTETPVVPDTTNSTKPIAVPDTAKPNVPVQKPVEPAPASIDPAKFFATYFNAEVALESPFSKERLGISPSALAQWRADTAHIRQGIRYLALRETVSALQEFQQLESSRFAETKSVAGWYMALVYLQQNDMKKCKEQLQNVISDPESPYSKRAKELLTNIQ
ncbi:hypothetical protein LZD49_02890 [Dyadobacter sp. CY261]|uniref:hypothetical protein n=1 Tax=Dyadobacter sp. CY261 TaxID=2907203 RepID=UPI001F3CCA63|nr:hypothetical protein [Dyadobacter sp. CY261]MCF0069399.1 hypothetical protein [Dyadobacter sp. CY261]